MKQRTGQRLILIVDLKNKGKWKVGRGSIMYRKYKKKKKVDDGLKFSKAKQVKKERSWKTVKASCERWWGKCITLRDGDRCCLCGQGRELENHHIIIRGHKVNIGWFLLENGIRLCKWGCHQGGRHSSNFKTQQEFEKKILEYMVAHPKIYGGISYEALHYRCRDRKISLDIRALEAVELGLKNYYKELVKQKK